MKNLFLWQKTPPLGTGKRLLSKFHTLTPRIEPYWTLVLVPVWQEVTFRYLPWRFWYLAGGNFWIVGITSSLAFATIHWYFGKWFMVWGFIGGMIAWFVMTKFGIVAAIVLHMTVNVVDLTFGLRNYIIRR